MKEIERHQLLQEQQRGTGELRRLPPGGHGSQNALDAVHHQDVAKVDAVVGVIDDAERPGEALQIRMRRPEASCKVG